MEANQLKRFSENHPCVFLDIKSNMSQQCDLVVKKVKKVCLLLDGLHLE